LRQKNTAKKNTAKKKEEKDRGAKRDEKATPSFEELGLSDVVLANLKKMGFEEPTPVQYRTIPILMSGRDVVVQAKTGTGKTAAFGIPIVEHLLSLGGEKGVYALVLTPTRELSLQVAGEMKKIGHRTPLRCAVLYGGQNIEKQIRDLSQGANVVVGTPGRVMDHIRRGTLDLSSVGFFVLDEADRMLDMGFIEDIEWVISRLPEKRQNALFSATIPEKVANLATEYMNNPIKIYVSRDELTVEGIEQVYYRVGRINKLWALGRVIDVEKPQKAIIFCSTRAMVQRVASVLKKYGYSVGEIRGDMPQKKREKVLSEFREGKIRFLVATDVAARGLDIPDVTHVINYDLPEDPITYVHRIGRTGRAGSTGVAITFVSPREKQLLSKIEFFIGKKIRHASVPEKKGGRDRIRRRMDFEEYSDPFGMVSFQIDVGRLDGFGHIELLSLLRRAGVEESLVGDIEVSDNHTVFQVHRSAAPLVWKKLPELSIRKKGGGGEEGAEKRINLTLVKQPR